MVQQLFNDHGICLTYLENIKGKKIANHD